MTYKTGDKLCNCTLLAQCGSGAYGEVWLAEDSIGSRVALKIIRVGGRYNDRELAGVKYFSQCNHPNLLKIRYVETVGDELCYIMDAADDLHDGKGGYLPDTLGNRLRKNGRLEAGEIIDMLNGLLDGLSELHKHNLLHRDIKPDNILWVNGRAVLADAGTAAPDGAASLVGSPGFLSEKLLRKIAPADASDDLYALGKVAYCALTGLPVGEYPDIPENVPLETDSGLNRLIRACGTETINSVAEFREIIGSYSGKSEKKPGVRRLRITCFIATVFVLFLVAAWYWWGSRQIADDFSENVALPVY